jgi:hypothetical protein
MLISGIDEIAGYLHLAQVFRGRSLMWGWDRALLMASIAACELQMDPLAELCQKMKPCKIILAIYYENSTTVVKH